MEYWKGVIGMEGFHCVEYQVQVFWVVRPCNSVFWFYTCLACPYFISIQGIHWKRWYKWKYRSQSIVIVYLQDTCHKKTTINSLKGTQIP
jgi:hypothetical protein